MDNCTSSSQTVVSKVSELEIVAPDASGQIQSMNDANFLKRRREEENDSGDVARTPAVSNGVHNIINNNNDEVKQRPNDQSADVDSQSAKRVKTTTTASATNVNSYNNDDDVKQQSTATKPESFVETVFSQALTQHQQAGGKGTTGSQNLEELDKMRPDGDKDETMDAEDKRWRGKNDYFMILLQLHHSWHHIVHLTFAFLYDFSL